MQYWLDHSATKLERAPQFLTNGETWFMCWPVCDEILIENLSPSHHSGESKHIRIWEVECEQEEFLLACRESSLAHVRSPPPRKVPWQHQTSQMCLFVYIDLFLMKFIAQDICPSWLRSGNRRTRGGPFLVWLNDWSNEACLGQSGSAIKTLRSLLVRRFCRVSLTMRSAYFFRVFQISIIAH